MDVRVITADGVTRHSSDDLEALLDGPGLVWIDVKYWDADTAAHLAARLHLHERAVHDCAVRNPMAKVHTYPDQAFVVLHAPVQGRGGHVHFVELDQFVGPNWLLTVHGPMNVALELDEAYVETTKVARRLDKGTVRPGRACELSGALVGAVTFGLAWVEAVVIYGARGVHTLPVDLVQLWVGTTVATALFGLLGVALGALTRNTVAAILGGIGWTMIIEIGILASLAPEVTKWLPAGAAVALTTVGSAGSAMLSPWVASAVLAGWAIALSGIAARFTLSREAH